MIITSIHLQSIRNHEVFATKLLPNVTLITGSNGSGKTSIIEALYVALRGTSFRGTDKDLLRYGADWWRIDVGIEGNVGRTVSFDPSKTTGRKKFIVDEKNSYRLSLANKYPVVLFEPDDLRLISGSPTRRRQFIDTLVSSINPNYATTLRKYERALKQRNTLLKRQFVTADDVFVWNVSLSEYGAELVMQRVAFIEKLNKTLSVVYNTIATSKDDVSIHYSDTLIGNTSQKIMSELHARFERDKILGYTTTGPHRHDIIFKFNNTPALANASRGEIRTIILALKFLEVALTEELTGNKPIILLDDVFGELDKSRQTELMQNFKDHQIILTSASAPEVINDVSVIELSK